MPTPPEVVESSAPSAHNQFIDEHIASLQISPRVIEAFRSVDRALFVPEEHIDRAYTDEIVGIKEGSSVSQPSLVAMMTAFLDVQPSDTVLEVGTASGYQAAVLSRLGNEVHTIEFDEDLAEQARDRLARLGYADINVHTGDGAVGLVDQQPFDRIIVTAALRDAPRKLLDQLAVGGKLLAPIGEAPEECYLTQITKEGDDILTTDVLGACHFVPLISEEDGGWSRSALEELRKQRDEQARANLKSWLSPLYEKQGLAFERVTEIMAGRLLKIIDHEGVEMPEHKILDIIGFVLAALPRPEKEPTPKPEAEEAAASA